MRHYTMEIHTAAVWVLTLMYAYQGSWWGWAPLPVFFVVLAIMDRLE